MRVIERGGLPIKLWLDYLEDGAEEQAVNLSKLPFAFHHIAIMPDSHQGFGMPIGAVLATEGAIVPNAVGGDIGCGMNAVKTSVLVEEATFDKIKEVIKGAQRKIPVGAAAHKVKQSTDWMPSLDTVPYDAAVVDEYEKARYQLGTLGGGNHFIEIQAGSDGYVWLMLHSGSRHLGQVVNKRYDTLARELNKKWHTNVPPGYDLAFLPVDENESDYVHYVAEMQFALKYAEGNRALMMDNLTTAFSHVFRDTEYTPVTNIAHNFASFEKHFGHKVWVHRKGATQAFEGQLGIIPGSMGTGSYIVRGKGNRESFMSCSHGAGRVLGRNQAKKTLNLADELAKMDGIVHTLTATHALDEAPGAYKDIESVMENQKDLVDIVVKLRPLGNLKG